VPRPLAAAPAPLPPISATLPAPVPTASVTSTNGTSPRPVTPHAFAPGFVPPPAGSFRQAQAKPAPVLGIVIALLAVTSVIGVGGALLLREGAPKPAGEPTAYAPSPTVTPSIAHAGAVPSVMASDNPTPRTTAEPATASASANATEATTPPETEPDRHSNAKSTRRTIHPGAAAAPSGSAAPASKESLYESL
jgi:hypothetical protein